MWVLGIAAAGLAGIAYLAWQPRDGRRGAETETSEAASPGARLYADQCARCHNASGEGLPRKAPPLPGDPVVAARDPAELIRAVLDGVGGKTIRGEEYPARMPAFRLLLNDEQVAAVVNYVRSRWGRQPPTVTPAHVQEERTQP